MADGVVFLWLIMTGDFTILGVPMFTATPARQDVQARLDPAHKLFM